MTWMRSAGGSTDPGDRRHGSPAAGVRAGAGVEARAGTGLQSSRAGLCQAPTGEGCQVLPPSWVNQMAFWAGSAGTATPCAVVVIPT